MSCFVKQISFMEKTVNFRQTECREIEQLCALRGQRINYQLVINGDEEVYLSVTAESVFPVKIFIVRSVPADCPATVEDISGDGYLTETAEMIPDVLVPLEEQNNTIRVGNGDTVLWVQVDVPVDAHAGEGTVAVLFRDCKTDDADVTSVMNIRVTPESLPNHGIRYTRWFHADCIAAAHGVGIFSEQHWELIEKYIAAAVNVGINMILVPIHTPPLDTAQGTARPCVQLVDIDFCDGEYTFGMEKLDRFIGICKRCGVIYYEMAHLFSQWGAKFTPNIMVTENGTASYKFGWHVPSDSSEYAYFLEKYISAVRGELERQGVLDNTYFHISDEPTDSNIDTYRRGYELIRPLVGEGKVFDALSHREFWESGLVKIPVTSVRTIHEFLECPVEEQWVYYCCFPQTVYPNSFLAMYNHRIRAIGIMIYKYGIKGFLHWGFNFYNTAVSRYGIDPYLTTSGDGAFPSGDGFIVYPGVNGVYGSVRGEVMRQALDDIAVCRALEAKLGRDAVVEMIDRAAGMDVRFDQYPRCDFFYDKLREEMLSLICGV